MSKSELLALLQDMKEVKRNADCCISRLEEMLEGNQSLTEDEGPRRRASARMSTSTLRSEVNAGNMASIARQQSLNAARRASTDVAAVVESTFDQSPMMRDDGLKVSVWDCSLEEMTETPCTLRYMRASSTFTLEEPASFMGMFGRKSKLPVTEFHLSNCKRCYAGAIGAEEEEDLYCFTIDLLIRHDEVTSQDLTVAFRVDSEKQMQDRDSTLMAIRWLKEHKANNQREQGGAVLSSASSLTTEAEPVVGEASRSARSSDGRLDIPMESLFAAEDQTSARLSLSIKASGSPLACETPLKERMAHLEDFSGMDRMSDALERAGVNPLGPKRSSITRDTLSEASRGLLSPPDSPATGAEETDTKMMQDDSGTVEVSLQNNPMAGAAGGETAQSRKMALMATVGARRRMSMGKSRKDDEKMPGLVDD